MAVRLDTIDVYKSGPLTVVGFGTRNALDVSVVACQNELAKVLRESNCHTLAVDLTGVRLVASGMLGVFASVQRRGVRVLLFNPSPDLVEVLEITKLDRLLAIHRVEV
jgi:anti-sigma B factor antagonist